MSAELKPSPEWAKRALQGVVYWIGHRRCLYCGHPLSEGALVAEVCNLIYANLPANRVLLCEVQYSKLLGGEVLKAARKAGLRKRARMDIVVFKKDDREPLFVIEVKRAGASDDLIDKDLWRLAQVRSANDDVRAFLFVISEADRPTRFVDKEGKSILKERRIDGSDCCFRVRHTLKAAHFFDFRDKAQYASLIEVYPATPPAKRRRRLR